MAKKKKHRKCLELISTSKLLKEIAKRQDLQKFKCGIYQGYTIQKKYTSPEPQLPPVYYAVIVPCENSHISSE